MRLTPSLTHKISFSRSNERQRQRQRPKTMFAIKNIVTRALLILLLLATLQLTVSQSSGDPAPGNDNPSVQQQQCQSPDISSSASAASAAATSASPSKSSKECLTVTEHGPEVVTTSESEENVAPNYGQLDEPTTPNNGSTGSSRRLVELAQAQIHWLEQEHKGMFDQDKIHFKPVDQDNNGQLQTDTILLGLFASQDIPKDTVLMKIPRSILLTGGEFSYKVATSIYVMGTSINSHLE
jgi:hypothetical protein